MFAILLPSHYLLLQFAAKDRAVLRNGDAPCSTRTGDEEMHTQDSAAEHHASRHMLLSSELCSCLLTLWSTNFIRIAAASKLSPYLKENTACLHDSDLMVDAVHFL